MELIDPTLAREYPFFSVMAPLLKSDKIAIQFFYLWSLYEHEQMICRTGFLTSGIVVSKGAESGDAE